VGRKRINDEFMSARFPSGTFARIDAHLREREARSDFIRSAVDAEIAKREASACPPPAKKKPAASPGED
jgi:hypothetical protein